MGEKEIVPDSDQPRDAFEKSIVWHIKNLDAGINGKDDEMPFMSGQRSGFAYAIAIYRDCCKRGII